MKKQPPVLNVYLVYSPKNEVRSLNKVFKKFCKDTYHYAENHWLVNSNLTLREFCDEIYNVKKQRVLVLEIKEYTGCNHGDFWGKSFPILVQVRLREQSVLSAPSDKSNQSKRREIVDAQQDIIKGFIKLEKCSEGYRQHDAFEAISTLFNQTYDSFMEIFNKKNPI